MVALIIAVRLSHLYARVEKLERALKKTSAASAVERKLPSASAAGTERTVPSQVSTVATEAESLSSGRVGVRSFKAQTRENKVDEIVAWLARDWPMKAGAVLLVIAVGWFVTYAFINDWIGPVGRIALGLLFGLLLLLVGARRAALARTQGNVLMFVGAAAVLVTLLAGITVYEMFSVPTALTVILATVIFMALQSLEQKNEALAAATLAFGGLAPSFVISLTNIDTVFLYLFVLMLGSLWLTGKVGWRSLNPIVLAAILAYSFVLPVIFHFEKTIFNILFVSLFVAMFFFGNLSVIVRSVRVGLAEVAVAVGTGVLFVYWVWMLATENSQVSLWLTLGAFLFAFGAYVVFLRTCVLATTLVYSGLALALLAIATAFELSGNDLLLAYVLEFGLAAAVLAGISRSLSARATAATATGLFLLPVLMSFSPIERIFNGIRPGYPVGAIRVPEDTAEIFLAKGPTLSQMIPDLLPLAAICAAALAIAAVAAGNVSAATEARVKFVNTVLVRIFAAVAGAYAMLLVWFLSHLFLPTAAMAVFVALTIYTLFGIGFYIEGTRSDHSAYKAAAAVLLAIVLFRLFLVEFWQMSIVVKIITFFVIGGLFVSTAFLATRKKD